MAAQTTLTQFKTHGGIPENVLGQKSPDFVKAQIEAAEALAYGYVSAAYAAPFVTLPLEFVIAVCRIAAYEIMLSIGYNPETDGDTNYKSRADASIAWLRDVGKGIARLAVVADATPASAEGAPAAYTSAPRGW